MAESEKLIQALVSRLANVKGLAAMMLALRETGLVELIEAGKDMREAINALRDKMKECGFEQCEGVADKWDAALANFSERVGVKP